MITANTKWNELAAYQNLPHDTINAQRGQLDAALTELLILGDGDVVLTEAEFTTMMAIQMDGTQTANIDLEIPSTVSKMFVVDNSQSSYQVILGKPVPVATVEAGETAILISDVTTGQINLFSSAGAAAATQYAITGYEDDVPTASKVVLFEVLVKAGDVPVGATNSEAHAAVTATANYDFDLQKNGVSFGTLTFNAGVNDGSFTVASLTSFVAGDRLAIVGDATPDSTLEDITFSIVLE